ncbi:MAG: hydrogenase 4 subunit B [Nitrososphaerota archaeon]|nr:hydrogenase 4 subunit B [Nitrososphaerota archaeon]
MIVSTVYSPILFILVFASFVSGAFLPLLFREGRKATLASFAPSALGSLLVVALSLSIITSGSAIRFSSPLPAAAAPLAMDFYIGGISAFFMLIIGLVTLAVSFYSVGYCAEYYGKRSVRELGFLLNVFVLSMLLVTAANNVFTFLVFWETMSLASFFLVIYEHENISSMKSGITYIVMTHLGTAFIIGAFLLLYFQTGSLSFDVFRTQAPVLPQYTRDLVFGLAVVGFGTKAGIVPLHVWLPQAHPSAPSNVSALMSGVMIKVAIYGLVLFALGFAAPASPADAWLGMLLVAAGAVSSLIGVMYAAIEHDIKRALAFHSVENIGIIVIGLGLSVVFMSFNLVVLASLALLASMYHALNHAIFKSLLFMGAGSVLFSTGTRDMNRMGGLVKRMPWTALLFLVGAVAIAGLPPLNGFVSEWLTFQALLSSYQVPNVALQILVSLAGAAFALTVGLSLATFVKLFGISFLSRPRSEEAENAKEVPRTMIAGMSVMACLCVVLGVLPFLGARLVSSSFGFDLNFVGSPSPFGPLTATYALDGLTSVSSMSMPVVVALMGSAAAGLLGFTAVTTGLSGKTARRINTTWDCGFGMLNERMEYTASSLSQPIRTVFKALYKPHTSIKREHYSDSNVYMNKSVSVVSETRDVFEAGLYTGAVRATESLFDKVRRIQTGKVNSYLLYIMVVLVLFLFLAGVVP